MLGMHLSIAIRLTRFKCFVIILYFIYVKLVGVKKLVITMINDL